MALSIETQSKLNLARAKLLAGNLSDDELKEAMRLMREDRVGSQDTSTKARAPKKAAPDADALLSELEGL